MVVVQPTISIQVNGRVQWAVSRSPEGEFVALCAPLGLAMQGSSLDDLYANISEAVQLVMNDLLRAGELDQFLRDHGWTAMPFAPNQVIGVAPVAFDVPIELVIQAQRDSARAIRQ